MCNSTECGVVDDQLHVVFFLQIQCVLQDIGSAIATPQSSARDAHLSKLLVMSVVRFELSGIFSYKEGARDLWEVEAEPFSKVIHNL